MNLPSLPSLRSPGLPTLRLLAVATLVALSTALWYLVSHQLRDESGIRWFSASPNCDLHRAPCTVTLGEHGILELTATADGRIQALEPLPLTVAVEGMEARSVRVDLVGRNMDMGLHRFPLERQADGRFHGEGQVPICTEARMDWQARVVVETSDGRLGGRFDFTVERSTP
ncbi:MAG: hypothetical protein ACQEUM_14810 [Pseudomonadota bacterium]